MRESFGKMDCLKSLKEMVFSLRLGLVFVCAAAMLGGCASMEPENSSTKITYAGAASAKDACTLNIITLITVTSFNGEEVKWKAEGMNNWASVQIPAGSHAFVIDYKRSVGGGFRPGTAMMRSQDHVRNGIAISYDKFEAGHTYEMVAAEGMESVGILGALKNPAQAMRDSSGNALRILIRDVTQGVDRKADVLYGPAGSGQ